MYVCALDMRNQVGIKRVLMSQSKELYGKIKENKVPLTGEKEKKNEKMSSEFESP